MFEVLENWHWLRPLWLLAIPIPLIVLFTVMRSMPTSSTWSKYVDKHLLQALLAKQSDTTIWLGSRRIKLILVAGFLLCIFALAGPSWEKVEQPPLQSNGKLIIISDMTLSMFASDMAPSRLVRQKFKIREFIKAYTKGEMALIAYSGDAHVVTPFTEDYQAVDNLISGLSPEIIPAIGSNPESAFQLAIELLEPQPGPATIVLFTDEVLEQSAQRIKKLLQDFNAAVLFANKLELIVVGIGTTQGSPVKLPSGRFIVDKNNDIVSIGLNRQKLQQFANTNAAQYLELTDDNRDINRLISLTDRLAAVKESDQQIATKIDYWKDRGGILILLSLPIFLLAFRKGFILPCLLVTLITPTISQKLYADDLQSRLNNITQSSVENIPQTIEDSVDTSVVEQANQSDSFWRNLWQRPDQQGFKAVERGAWEDASDTFADPAWRGFAADQGGDFEKAELAYEEALQQNSPQSLPEQALLYNQSLAKARQYKFEESLASLDKALTIDPDFKAAIEAKELIEKLLQSQQQSEQQSQDQSQEQDQENGEQGQQGDQASSDNQDQSGTESDIDRSEQADESEPSNQQAQSHSQTGEDAQAKDSEQSFAEHSEDSGESDDEKNSREEISSQSQSEQQGDEASEQSRISEENGAAEESENKDKQLVQQRDQEDTPSVIQQSELSTWLNQIEDDPSGLLRRKFEYERRVREREGEVVIDNENQQLW